MRRVYGFTVPSGMGYAPSPIGASPSNVQGRPTTVYTELVSATGERTGQRLTVLPVAYVPSVSSVGVMTSTGGGPSAKGGVPVLWLAIGIAILLAGALLVTAR